MASTDVPPAGLSKYDTSKSAGRDSVPNNDKVASYASAPGVFDDVVRVIDHKAERRLCRRFDIRLLPVLAIMCMSPSKYTGKYTANGTDLFNALDKGNLGNAETDGLSKGMSTVSSMAWMGQPLTC